MVVSLAPDLDFIPGLLTGDAGRYHQGVSHSVTFALAAAALGAAVLALRRHPFGASFAVLFAAYGSHLVLDLLGGTDSRPPLGMPLLWPFTDVVIQSPVPLFLGVRHNVWGTPADWLRSLFQWFNLASVALEVVLLGPFLIWGLRRRRRLSA